jgi:ADP-heptose:LPS heptosyltransferase
MNISLPIQEVLNLGYTIKEFEDLGVFPEDIESFRKHPSQMIAAKFKVKGKTQLQGRMIDIKPGLTMVIDINDFIKLYTQTKGQAITGTSIVKDYFNLYQGQDLNNKKLLFWCFGCGWGDLLFMQAILRNIKIKYPKCSITWALPQIYHGFVRTFDIASNIISTPFEAKHIKKNNYHLHFDNLINNYIEGKTKNCYELMAEFTNLDINKEDLNPKIKVNKQSLKYITKQDIPDKFIVLHMRTSTPMRNPGIRFKLSILDKLLMDDFKVVFVDSADKKEDIDFLIDNCVVPEDCYNFAGITRNMNDVTALLSLAQCVVSVDTSMIHIATAVGTPTYGLYGPFPGELRVSTYLKNKWVNGTCDISPCQLHQQELCPKGSAICYDNIDLGKTIEEIKTLI